MRNSHRLIADSIMSRGKFVAVYSQGREFVFGDGFFHNNIFWPMSHTKQMVQLYRRRFEHYGHGTADQAIVDEAVRAAGTAWCWCTASSAIADCGIPGSSD